MLGTVSGTRCCGSRGGAWGAHGAEISFQISALAGVLNLGPRSLMAANVTTRLRRTPKKCLSKITVLVFYNVHDNVPELWLFVREFTIVATLNPSLKSRYM